MVRLADGFMVVRGLVLVGICFAGLNEALSQSRPTGECLEATGGTLGRKRGLNRFGDGLETGSRGRGAPAKCGVKTRSNVDSMLTMEIEIESRSVPEGGYHLKEERRTLEPRISRSSQSLRRLQHTWVEHTTIAAGINGNSFDPEMRSSLGKQKNGASRARYSLRQVRVL